MFNQNLKIMKKIIFFILIFVGILIFQNCKKDESVIENSYEMVTTKQDKDFNNLARVISAAVNESVEFRKIIKNEALNKFDGDYDILMKNIKNQEISSNTNKEKKIRIGSFLSDYAKKLNIKIPKDLNNKTSIEDYIDYLTQQYPDLQISVPVHTEEWTDDYEPKVTFIPENLQDSQDIDIIAYQNNTTTSVNTLEEPNEPVIVIGINERMNLIDDISNSEPFIISNWNLQGSQTSTGIHLQWTYDYQGDETIIRYLIYRKSFYDNDFHYIGSSDGVNNTTYNDNTTNSNASYDYYVVARSVLNTSNPSNIVNVTAPDRPLSVTSFNANVYASNETALYWTYPSGQYLDYLSLSKRIVNQENNFVEIQRFTNNEFDYVDTNNNAGNTIIYKSQIVANNVFSNPKYDIVKVPYRNISVPTKLYIKKIELDDVSDVEPWLRGAPEFIISVIKGSENSTNFIHKRVYLEFDHRTNSQTFNKRLADWLPDNWMEIYTFTMVEDDPATWSTSVNFNVAYQIKDSTKQNIITNGINLKIDDLFGANDDVIGEAYLRFTDPITSILHFPDKSNTKMTISDH